MNYFLIIFLIILQAALLQKQQLQGAASTSTSANIIAPTNTFPAPMDLQKVANLSTATQQPQAAQLPVAGQPLAEEKYVLSSTK